MTTSTLQTASELFARYPQAVRVINDSGTVRSMTLLMTDGDDAQFFILHSQDDGEPPGPFFSIFQRSGGGDADLGDETVPVPGWAVDAVTRGVPLPRDGSLYGWAGGGRVTAVIPFSTRFTPEPSWSVMPDADKGKALWPPFAGEHLAGPWLWEHFRAGRIVDLASIVAGTEGIVFWVDTVRALGSGCIAVASDLTGPDGWTLPRGRYVYCQHRGNAPSLGEMLADPGKTDLAPRFCKF